MTTDNTILEMLSSSGEDHDDGPSRTQSCLECARRARLDEQQEDVNVLAPHNEGRNVGTITHKLVWCHHTGVDPELYVPRHSDNGDIEVLLNGPRKKGCGAWPLFEDYAEQFPPDFWGRIIGAELELEDYLDDDTRRSGVIDLLVEMDEETVQRIQDTFEVELNGPGIYTWDMKTGTALRSNLLADWEWHPQPAQYQWLVYKTRGIATRGHIVCQAVGYVESKKTGKRPPSKFQIAVVPPLDETSELRWRQQVEKAATNLENDDFNTTHCNAWFRECPYKTSGECEGV